MNRLEVLQLGASALSAPVGPVSNAHTNPTPLPYLAYGVGIGSGRGVGVFFDEPVLVVQHAGRGEVRVTIPRANFAVVKRWIAAPEPKERPSTEVEAPGSDVRYGRAFDRPTAMCAAARGVYIALIAFPAMPYVVHYDPDRAEFQTYALGSNVRITVLFERAPRLYYVAAATAEPQFIDSVT